MANQSRRGVRVSPANVTDVISKRTFSGAIARRFGIPVQYSYDFVQERHVSLSRSCGRYLRRFRKIYVSPQRIELAEHAAEFSDSSIGGNHGCDETFSHFKRRIELTLFKCRHGLRG